MSNGLFTKLPYDRPHIHPAHPNWQTNQNKGKVFSCFADLKKAWLNLAWGSAIKIDGKRCWEGKHITLLNQCTQISNVQLKWAIKHRFIFSGPWGETGMQLEPHPLQHIYQRIGKVTRTVCSTRPHPNIIWRQMSTVCWSGASVPNQGGPTRAPRYSAQILSDLGPDSKSQ